MRLSEMKLFVLAWPETPLVRIRFRSIFYYSHFTSWSGVLKKRPLFILFGGIVAFTKSIKKLEVIHKWALYKRTVFSSHIFF